MFPKTPPCFDGDGQFWAWQRAAWETGLNARFGFCEDCTPNHAMAQQLMEKWNWC